MKHLSLRWTWSLVPILLAACGGTEPSATPPSAFPSAAEVDQADFEEMADEVPSEPPAPADRMTLLAASPAQAARMPASGVVPVSAASAHSKGVWSAPFDTGLVGIHLNVLSSGQLMYYGATVAAGRADTKSLHFATLRPGDSFVDYPDAVSVASFCTGNIGLPDGKVLLTGGTAYFPKPGERFQGARLLATYRQGGSQLNPLGAGLAEARWYPTNVMLDPDHVAVLGGLDDQGLAVAAPEVINVRTGAVRKLGNVDLRPLGFSYPRAVLVGVNQIVVLRRSDGAPYLLDTRNAGSLKALPTDTVLPSGPLTSLGGGRYLVAGSSGNRLGVSDARMITIGVGGVSSAGVAGLRTERTYHELTTLPDGSVLATGGTDGQATPTHHLSAERYVRGSGWTRMADAALTRGYHSTAGLLPDATVIKMGSTRPVQTQAEIFYPPYLFASDGKPKARPQIDSWSRNGNSGRADIELVMKTDRSLSAVNLLRIGSTTHQTPMGDAFHKASFSQKGRNVTVKVSADVSRMPAGQYWVFALDTDGTPSVAASVRIE